MQDSKAEGSVYAKSEQHKYEAALKEQEPIAQLLKSSNVEAAMRLCRTQYLELVGRYCAATLGSLSNARQLAVDIIDKALPQWPCTDRDATTLRAHLLLQAKKRCAIELSSTVALQAHRQSTTAAKAVEARRLLSELRPSERELLVLRRVCAMSYAELSSMLGVDEFEVIERLSLSLAEACYATDPRISPSFASQERKEFIERLELLVDGTAAPSLCLRIAENDLLRDELHVATQVVKRIALAGSDLPELAESANGNSISEVALQSQPPVTERLVAQPVAGVEHEKQEPHVGAQAMPPTPQIKAEQTVQAAKEATAVAPVPTQEPKASLEVAPLPKKQAWVIAGLVGLVALGVLAATMGTKKADKTRPNASPATNVTFVRATELAKGGKVKLCTDNRTRCQDAKAGVSLTDGESLRTEGPVEARVTLGAQGEVELLPNSEIVSDRANDGAIGLVHGSLSVDARGAPSNPLVVTTEEGSAKASRAKFTLQAESNRTALQVNRGEVTLTNRSGRQTQVKASEQGLVEGTNAPIVQPGGPIVQNRTSEIDNDDRGDRETGLRGLGQLYAKKPSELKERSDAVRLSRHHVTARIVGAVARTEIDEVFTNDTNDVLEGVFRFSLPADAQIERLALEVDGRFEEGAFVDRDRAAAIWRGNIVNAAKEMRQQFRDEIVWVPGPWRDPALLEWQRGNRFELRIYPIPKQGQRRIVLSYTQVLSDAFGRRQYSYPLPLDASAIKPIEDFAFDLSIRSHDPSVAPTVSGYRAETKAEGTEVTRLLLNERRFVPRGDLNVSFALPNREKSLLAWAYRPEDSSERGYAAMLLRPKLPVVRSSESRQFAFIVDVSRSMYGENLRRATRVVSKMLRELSPDDTVSLLACHSSCETWERAPKSLDEKSTIQADGWMNGLVAEGASDPALAVKSAIDGLTRTNSLPIELVYVGDGAPTVGATRPHALEAAVRKTLDGRDAQLTAISVGTDSDLESLRALARGGHGVVLPYVPGTSATEESARAMASLLGARLSDVEVELPAGLSLATRPDDVLSGGQELQLTARLDGPSVRGDVILRGRVGEKAFEQRYPISLDALPGERHAFVPRLYAAARIAELDRSSDPASKREAIELSRRFSVASRYTSLLVLESQAMFKAFGLDNKRVAQTWTGELESEATTSDREQAADNAQPSEKKSEAATAQGESMSASMGVASGGGAMPGMSARGAGPLSVAPAPAMAADMSNGPSAEAKALRASPGNMAKPSAARRSALAMDEEPMWQEQPRRMVPMRRIWERKGQVLPGDAMPSQAIASRVAAAQLDVERNPDRRTAVKQLFDLYVASGDYRRADKLSSQWNDRDPFDVEAIVARADTAARKGDRDFAIRILGSVVDVRPSDVGAQQRLMRLLRWQGRANVACRFAYALAAFRLKDTPLIAEALRCAEQSAEKDGTLAILRQELVTSLDDKTREEAEKLAAKARTPDSLSGDVQLIATWNGADAKDLDIALVDPDGHRISWLGAPSKSVISALNVVSTERESLALRGGRPGDYVIELTCAKARSGDNAEVSGTVDVQVAGTRQTVPFRIVDGTKRLGIVRISSVSKLVPLSPSSSWPLQIDR